jgi:hypothetical protein
MAKLLGSSGTITGLGLLMSFLQAIKKIVQHKNKKAPRDRILVFMFIDLIK